jgi:hypothetical protein
MVIVVEGAYIVVADTVLDRSMINQFAWSGIESGQFCEFSSFVIRYLLLQACDIPHAFSLGTHPYHELKVMLL